MLAVLQERFVVHITDVLAVSMMLGITAQVKEAGTAWDKGEKKSEDQSRPSCWGPRRCGSGRRAGMGTRGPQHSLEVESFWKQAPPLCVSPLTHHDHRLWTCPHDHRQWAEGVCECLIASGPPCVQPRTRC